MRLRSFNAKLFHYYSRVITTAIKSQRKAAVLELPFFLYKITIEIFISREKNNQII